MEGGLHQKLSANSEWINYFSAMNETSYSQMVVTSDLKFLCSLMTSASSVMLTFSHHGNQEKNMVTKIFWAVINFPLGICEF
jgi:choline-glycine betaine transporter